MRGLLILVTLVLINLPVVSQWRAERAITAEGLDWSAAIDDETAALAEESDQIEVRYVPGEPSSNRPVREVENSLVVVAAVSADVILLSVAALFVARHRARRDDPPASDATDATA